MFYSSLITKYISHIWSFYCKETNVIANKKNMNSIIKQLSTVNNKHTFLIVDGKCFSGIESIAFSKYLIKCMKVNSMCVAHANKLWKTTNKLVRN